MKIDTNKQILFKIQYEDKVIMICQEEQRLFSSSRIPVFNMTVVTNLFLI